MEFLLAGLLFQDMFNIKNKTTRSEETLGKKAHVVGDVKHAGRKKPCSQPLAGAEFTCKPLKILRKQLSPAIPNQPI